MANFTSSRLGLVNNSGTGYDALFLKVFAGEVLSSFRKATIFEDLHTVRTISSGKSAQFPIIGLNDVKSKSGNPVPAQLVVCTSPGTDD